MARRLLLATSHAMGHRAELVAVWWLRLAGYRILTRRYIHHAGEIDIIALDRGVLVFVEVKYRQTIEQALEALEPRQKKRILRAAEAFRQRQPKHAARPCRFDLVALAPWRLPRHVPDAWRP